MLDPNLESEIASYVQSAREYEMLKEGERPPLDETFPQIAAMQYYQAAEILWLNGEEERARPYLQKIFDIDPNFDLALRLIGIYPSGGSEPPEEYRAPMKPSPTGPKGSGFHRLPEPRREDSKHLEDASQRRDLLRRRPEHEDIRPVLNRRGGALENTKAHKMHDLSITISSLDFHEALRERSLRSFVTVRKSKGFPDQWNVTWKATGDDLGYVKKVNFEEGALWCCYRSAQDPDYSCNDRKSEAVRSLVHLRMEDAKEKERRSGKY